MKNYTPLIKRIAKELRKNHIDYQTSKYIFKEARREAEIKPERVKSTGSVTRMSRAEINRFLQVAYQQSATTGLMMQTLYESAARVSEFTNLKPTDIYEEGKLIIREGKGDKRREVPVSDHLIRLLKLHVDDRRQGYVFETNRHTKYSSRRIQQIVGEIAELAGINHFSVTPHTLRHTRATLLHEDGMPKDLVQSILGHEKPETTHRYTKTANYNLQAYRDIISL